MTDTRIDSEEVGYRLGAIVDGPWKPQVTDAMSFLSPKADLGPVLAAEWLPMASVSTLLAHEHAVRKKSLSHLLRPHWEDAGGISDRTQMKRREAIDEALIVLQLMELAVEMGYLPEEAVREQAREWLVSMLWSNPARSFVRDYDYLSVYCLAARVDVDIGQGSIEPPAVKPDAAVRFAAVLAEHKRWYDDPSIRAWLRFLDDYIVLEDEHDLVEEYLTMDRWADVAGSDPARRRLELLACGAEQFVVRLSTIIDLLDDEESARVGLLYSYWLAKFFGYDLVENGYVKVDHGWADDVAVGAIAPVNDEDLLAKRREAFRDRIAVIRSAWHGVRKLERTLRATAGKRKARNVPAWIQIPELAETEWATSALRRVGFWQPFTHSARANKTYGTCSVPGSQKSALATFIAEKASRDGSLKVRLVKADGTVRAQVFSAPKSGLMTTAMVLTMLDKLKF
jgi:hypothetical protein